MRDLRPMYFVWEPSDLPIYPHKVYVRSEARLWDLRGAPKKKKGQKKGQYLAYYLEGYWGI